MQEYKLLFASGYLNQPADQQITTKMICPQHQARHKVRLFEMPAKNGEETGEN